MDREGGQRRDEVPTILPERDWARLIGSTGPEVMAGIKTIWSGSRC
jgi:hypothetical protein